MQKSFLKGVTPALGVILLSAITVGVVSTAFYGISSLTEKTQNETSGLIEHEFDVMGAKLKIDVFGDCKIYLVNTGTKDVPIEVIGFYVAEPGTETYEPVTTSPTTGTIKKDATQEITFLNLNPKRYKLIVKIYGNRMDYGYLTCTGPAACFWNDDGCGVGSCSTTEMHQTCRPTGCLGGVCTEGETQCVSDPDCGNSLTATIDSPADDSTYNTGDSISFQGSASGGSGSYTYSWDFENGDTASGSSVTYDYSSTGDYTVTLTVNDNTDTATDSINIHITSAPSPAAFSCSIKTGSCGSETEVLALSGEENAHAETNTAGNYDYKLCCTNVSTVQTTTGTGDCNTLGAGFTGLITFATNSTFDKNSNAQVEKYNYTGTDGFSYKKNVCVELVGGASLDCIYDTKVNCATQGYTKYVVSISDNTNAHIGDEDAYSMVRCCNEIS